MYVDMTAVCGDHLLPAVGRESSLLPVRHAMIGSCKDAVVVLCKHYWLLQDGHCADF